MVAKTLAMTDTNTFKYLTFMYPQEVYHNYSLTQRNIPILQALA